VIIAMTFSTALWALIAALVIGVAAVCANPWRQLNRMVLGTCLHLVAWLGCLHFAFVEKPGIAWRQWAAVLAAGLIWQLWVLTSSVLKPGLRWMGRLMASWPWLVFWGVLAMFALDESFVSLSPVSGRPVYGGAYYGYILLFLAGGAGLGVQTLWGMRGLQGGPRLELQVLVLGGGVTALCGLTMVLIDQFVAARIRSAATDAAGGDGRVRRHDLGGGDYPGVECAAHHDPVS
jgi:hypothetical protein